MKVSKNSWHYKLVDTTGMDVAYRLRRNYTVSLCEYFSAVVASIALLCFIVMGASVVSFLFLSPLATFFVSFVGTDFGNGFLAFSASFGWLCMFIFWIALPLMIGVDEWRKGNIAFFPKWVKLNIPTRQKKQPSLVVEYLKAKKRKVCPLIELEKWDGK